MSRLRLGWIVGPNINFQTDLMHQAYSGLSAGYNQQYILWNASLGKKMFPNQRGEIKLYTFDILGQNRSVQRNVTEAYYEDVKPPLCSAVSCWCSHTTSEAATCRCPLPPAKAAPGAAKSAGGAAALALPAGGHRRVNGT